MVEGLRIYLRAALRVHIASRKSIEKILELTNLIAMLELLAETFASMEPDKRARYAKTNR